MPPDPSIAGGEEFPVRGDLLWTSTTVSPCSSLSSDTSLEEELVPALSSSVSTSSLSSDSEASTSASSEDSDYPPSPPIKTVKLATPKVLASSASSDEGYFATKVLSAAVKPSKTFLKKVFPRSKVTGTALPVPSVTEGWQLVLFDEGSDGQRVLYARGSDFEDMNLRENLVALLDRADEELDCDQVVVVLDKKDPNLASILHSLMYVGGVVIPADPASIHGKHSSKCVLVGIEV